MKKHWNKIEMIGLAGMAMLVSTFLAGCGASGPPRGQVHGKVVANGQPVTEGVVTFAPIATPGQAELGKAGMGEVQSDGTFTMGTEKSGDGVAIGRHRVMYSPPVIEWNAPEWDGTGPRPEAPKSPYAGMAPQQTEIEVKAGDNDVTIELTPAGR
ncbi:MAG: hypothetical protein KDA55_17055 [Planctomycetales bacterium]|nr:hypothetical protein [Planctomycetales bacterium]